MYYNTTHETGRDLKKYKAKATRQRDWILVYFTGYKPLGATPSEVAKSFPNTPITSIRRAITNLTDKGLLRKTSVKVKGPYGRPEYVWKLAEK